MSRLPEEDGCGRLGGKSPTMTRAVAPIATRIRLAALDDAPQIAKLSGELGYPCTAEQVRQRLERILGHPEHAVYLAEVSGDAGGSRVIGWAHVQVRRVVESDPQAEVGGLVVAQGYRRSGAGRLLMEHAEQWARTCGLGVVMLRSNVLRAGAHAFYERLGYAMLKVQKVFHKALEPGDDA